MKKHLILTIVLLLAMLIGCTGETEQPLDDPTETENPTPVVDPTAMPTEEPVNQSQKPFSPVLLRTI